MGYLILKVNIYSGEDQGHSSYDWLRTLPPPPPLPHPPKKKKKKKKTSKGCVFQTSARRRLIFL